MSSVNVPAPVVRDYLWLGSDRSPAGRARRIVGEVARRHGCTPSELRGPRKQYHRARVEALLAVADDVPEWTLRQLGDFFGDRDHSTIGFLLGRYRPRRRKTQGK